MAGLNDCPLSASRHHIRERTIGIIGQQVASRSDALGVLILASLLRRRLDGATVR